MEMDETGADYVAKSALGTKWKDEAQPCLVAFVTYVSDRGSGVGITS